MKIAILNDAHLDINSIQTGINLLPVLIVKLKKKNPDLIIIPGDLSNFAEDTIKIIEEIEYQIGVPVLFVPGNHDIWVDKKENSWDAYNLFANHHSSLIEKPYSILEDYVVIGDMGWYDYSFAPETIPHSTIRTRKKSVWNDAEFARWGMNDSELMNKMMDKFQIQLDKHKNKKIIFVNHFIPYKEFVTYKSSDAIWNLCNGFMGSANLGWLLNQYTNIEYVLFGHTHKRYGVIENFNNKTIVCNPIGYIGEWKTDNFSEELEQAISLIEI